MEDPTPALPKGEGVLGAIFHRSSRQPPLSLFSKEDYVKAYYHNIF